MRYSLTHWEGLSCIAKINHFQLENKSSEYYCLLELTNNHLSAEEQFGNINQATEQLFLSPEFSRISLVLKKYFVSDAVNQQKWLQKTANEALSIVQQPPLNGTKVAVLLYGIEDVNVYTTSRNETLIERPSYSHIFHTQQHSLQGNSYDQTHDLFSAYISQLEGLKANLKENCIRTWIYVQNVDDQYAGMVKARRELFEEQHLTKQTHFIASTGIEGKYINPEVSVLLDAYAVSGIQSEQIAFLKGASNLNPTHEYGVTFERGTSVQYGDRRHIFISGTASINNKGEIVHPLDIGKQIERTIENVTVLLNEAESDLNDAAYFLIYLRDMADYSVVDEYFRNNHPNLPYIIVLAPVCRPGWLIEMECVAIKDYGGSRFKDF